MPGTSESSTTLKNTFEFSGGKFDFTVTYVGNDKTEGQRAADHVMAAMQRPLRNCVDYFNSRTKDALSGDTPHMHTANTEMQASSVDMRIEVCVTTHIDSAFIDFMLAYMCRAIINTGGDCMVDAAISEELQEDVDSSSQSIGFSPFGMSFLMPNNNSSGFGRVQHGTDENRNTGQYL